MKRQRPRAQVHCPADVLRWSARVARAVKRGKMKATDANAVTAALRVALQAMQACQDKKLDALEEQIAALMAARERETAS